MGCVWLAHDPLSSVVHCYDAAIIRNDAFAVIAEGIGARGKWIPLAWHKDAEPFTKKLLDEYGINVLPDPCADKQSVAETISREIWSRMRSSRFRVDQRVGEWLNEYRSFFRDQSKIPQSGFPLMAATRHAIEMLNYAKPQAMPGSKKMNYPKLALI